MRSTRHNQTLRLMAWIKDRPNQWISAFEFQQFGPLCWRTEISRARKRFKAARDGTIDYQPKQLGPMRISGYMYLPEEGPEIGAVEPSQGYDTNAATPGRLL